MPSLALNYKKNGKWAVIKDNEAIQENRNERRGKEKNQRGT
jgi:hypothetical protein